MLKEGSLGGKKCMFSHSKFTSLIYIPWKYLVLLHACTEIPTLTWKLDFRDFPAGYVEVLH